MDPITLASLFAMAGGTYLQNQANNEAVAARNRVMAAERDRQLQMQRAQDGIVDAQTANMEGFTDDEGARRQELTEYFAAPTPGDANLQMGVVAPGASSVLVDELNRQEQGVQGRNASQGAALANVRAFGDVMGDRMTDMRRAGGDIDQLTGMRRGSQDASMMELDAAGHAGSNKRMLGDILSGAGSIGMGYANFANAGNPVVSDFVARLTGSPTSLAPMTTMRPMARPNMLG